MSEFETGTDVMLARYEGRVAVLTFNRPEARNALHPETYGAFEKLLPQLADDPQVGALMLTGWRRFLCWGDVKGMNARNSGGARPKPVWSQMSMICGNVSERCLRLTKFSQSKSGCIDGAAAGAGLSIALAWI
ncbi:MAG: hypothetical protein Ct9H300mP26_1480 [Acidimicrobiales bacterium]|nr:MAG: hypothetical protein Ct9H300mP26_1480 [Acidimicrobiales bacterium]